MGVHLLHYFLLVLLYISEGNKHIQLFISLHLSDNFSDVTNEDKTYEDFVKSDPTVYRRGAETMSRWIENESANIISVIVPSCYQAASIRLRTVQLIQNAAVQVPTGLLSCRLPVKSRISFKIFCLLT